MLLPVSSIGAYAHPFPNHPLLRSGPCWPERSTSPRVIAMCRPHSKSALSSAVACLAALTGCAAPRTQLAPVPKEAVVAEEEKQRELAIEDNQHQQERLDSVGLPIVRSGIALCPRDAGTRLSARFATAYQYEPTWRPAAMRVLGVGDTLTITSVTPGGAAAKAGLQLRDRILAVEGQRVATGAKSLKDFSERVTVAKESHPAEVTLTIERSGEAQQITIQPDRVCDYGNIMLQGEDLNAWADGTNIVVTSTMMRFADDHELQVVYAHEFAHNAMGHIQAKKKNSLFGALLGALGDIVMASRGINTGGYYTARGAAAGAMSFSQDFEREADYVGLYAMALAEIPLEPAPNFWRHFAQANPKSIGFAHTHPTTAERFVRMERAIAEINEKRARNLALRPEMKDAKDHQQAQEQDLALGYRSAKTEETPGATTAPEATRKQEPSLEAASVDSYQGYTAYTPANAPLSEPQAVQPTRPMPEPDSSDTRVQDQPPEPAVVPSVGYTRLPVGTNWIGDIRIKRYYPPGCAAQHEIREEQQVFFQTSEGAERSGFTRGRDC
jgi:peptidase M48-like protein/PDZ domain-containing protein